MIADNITPMKARSFAMQAFVALIFLIFFAALTFNFFGISVSFLFAPLILIYLWPRAADISFSYILLFAAGFFFDFLTSGRPGGWAVVFLIMLALVRPNERGKDIWLVESWISFTIWMGVFAIVLMGLRVLGVISVATGPLLAMVAGNLVLYPLVFQARRIVRKLLVGVDDL